MNTTLETTDVLAIALVSLERIDKKGSAKGTADIIRRHIGELNRNEREKNTNPLDSAVADFPSAARLSELHRETLPWHVVAVSGNHGGFGHKGVLVLNERGEGLELLLQAYGSTPLPKVGDKLDWLPTSEVQPRTLAPTTPAKAKRIISSL